MKGLGLRLGLATLKFTLTSSTHPIALYRPSLAVWRSARRGRDVTARRRALQLLRLRLLVKVRVMIGVRVKVRGG